MVVAASATSTDQPVVEVFLPPMTGFEMVRTFVVARRIVEEIYSDVGVRVVWGRQRSVPLGCEERPLHRKIVVAFRAAGPAEVRWEALAYSNPYSQQGPCVTLLTDRLKRELKTNPLDTAYVLGHVLAHEIGHVLEGIARHSETGLMKGRWSLRETTNMPTERLGFSAYDVGLVLRGLGARPAVGTGDGEE
jgi:hypothetical protein